MTDSLEQALARTLRPMRTTLQGVASSAQLDARMDAALSAWEIKRGARGPRLLPWSIAAAIALLVIGWSLQHALRERPILQSAAMQQPTPQSPLSSDSPNRPWQAEPAVFRVRASLGAAARPTGNGQLSERRYWVDVGVASDGSLRIVNVVPADSGYVP